MRKWTMLAVLPFVAMLCMGNSGCDAPQSRSGVGTAEIKIKAGSDGLTTEQRNIRKRYQLDNDTGSIKHLYVISAYSGQTIYYSTVVGKVTSSGKRLSPHTVSRGNGFAMNVGGSTHYTNEMLQDDGTYGSSVEYLYWFDSKGVYHQQYVTGGMILHVSDQPITVKGIIINMEIAQKPE